MQNPFNTSAKKQTGFIIDRRKISRIIEVNSVGQFSNLQKEDSNKKITQQMRSTHNQFNIRKINRSPGAIFRFKKHQNYDINAQHHMIKSFHMTYYDEQKRHNSVGKQLNPQIEKNYHFNAMINLPSFNNKTKNNFINCHYQQIQKNIEAKQNDQQINGNNNSFQELSEKQEQSQSKYQSFNMKGYIGLNFYLKKLIFHFQNRKSSIDMINTVRSYIEYIQNSFDIDNISEFKIQSLHKKIIRNAFLYQRLTALIVTYIELNDIFQICKKYINNMLKYSLQNYYIIGLLLTRGCDKQFNQLLKQQGKQNLKKSKTFNIQTIKTNNDVIIQSIYRLSKNDNLFYTNIRKIMKNNQSLTAMACFISILQYYAFYLWATQKAPNAPFLAIAPTPYLRQLQTTKYTLIIDGIQVFCSKSRKSLEQFRPFSQHFLQQMNQYYQIVVICNSMPNQANRLLAILDKKGRIKHKLYKYHMHHMNGRAIKDLNRFGRKLDKAILLDASTSLDDQNTINVPHWRGKKSDAELAQLCPLLAMIVLKQMIVQKALKQYRQKLEQNKKIGLKYSNYAVNLE